MKILVVEDGEGARESLAYDLRRRGNEILTAQNGLEALSKYDDCKLDEAPVDLVITDINMPVMNGITLIQRLREEVGFRGGIVVASGERDIHFPKEWEVLTPRTFNPAGYLQAYENWKAENSGKKQDESN